MKLKNKKTGEIGWLYCDHISVPKKMTVFSEDKDLSAPHWDYNSLAELNAEWEDYEEPEEDGLDHIITLIEAYNSVDDEYYPKEIIDKLKAWKRLKDRGFEFGGWRTWEEVTGLSCFDKGVAHSYYAGFTFRSEDRLEKDSQVKADLELLFGGGE